jgi:hypothetical protein
MQSDTQPFNQQQTCARNGPKELACSSEHAADAIGPGTGPLMTIYGIRLQNYKRLLLAFRDRPDQRHLPGHGMLTRFAAEAGLRSARYLSHVNNGRKNIGDELARQLERGMGQPVGWLDNEHAEGVTDAGGSAEEHFIGMARAIFRKCPVEAQNALLRILVDRLDARSER